MSVLLILPRLPDERSNRRHRNAWFARMRHHPINIRAFTATLLLAALLASSAGCQCMRSLNCSLSLGLDHICAHWGLGNGCCGGCGANGHHQCDDCAAEPAEEEVEETPPAGHGDFPRFHPVPTQPALAPRDEHGFPFREVPPETPPTINPPAQSEGELVLPPPALAPIPDAQSSKPRDSQSRRPSWVFVRGRARPAQLESARRERPIFEQDMPRLTPPR